MYCILFHIDCGAPPLPADVTDINESQMPSPVSLVETTTPPPQPPQPPPPSHSVLIGKHQVLSCLEAKAVSSTGVEAQQMPPKKVSNKQVLKERAL